MPRTGTQAANQALNGLDATGTPTNLLAFGSLHTADTGTTGANEATGGGYSRQGLTWNAASAGTKTNSSSATFTTSGATPITHFGTSSAASAGTFGIGGTLAASVTATTITVAPGALSIGAS